MRDGQRHVLHLTGHASGRPHCLLGAHSSTFIRILSWPHVPQPQPGCSLESPLTNHLWPHPRFMWKPKLKQKQPRPLFLRVESSGVTSLCLWHAGSSFTSRPPCSRHSCRWPGAAAAGGLAWFSRLQTLGCCLRALASGLHVNN